MDVFMYVFMYIFIGRLRWNVVHGWLERGAILGWPTLVGGWSVVHTGVVVRCCCLGWNDLRPCPVSARLRWNHVPTCALRVAIGRKLGVVTHEGMRS